MVDERLRVIRDLMLRLEEAGVSPHGAFTATFLPGEGWTFSSDTQQDVSSSSSAGGTDASSSTIVRPQPR